MAPKKLKTTKGASSSRAQAYDSSKFASEDAAKWYDKLIQKKKLIPEKGLKLDEELDAEVLAMIQRRGWQKFIAVQPPSVLPLVREFYANVHDAQNRQVFVRGKYVSIAAETINSFYDTPNFPEGDEYSIYAKQVKGIGGDLDTLLRTLCIPGAQWIRTSTGRPKEFMVGKMKPEFRIWYSLATSRLCPSMHTSHVTVERAIVVYALGNGLSFDVGSFIYRLIRHSGSRLNQGLWFPSLITELCRRAGVPIDANEEVLSVSRPIEVIRQSATSELPSADAMTGHMESSVPLSGSVPPSIATLSDQISLMMARQERFIRHQNLVNSAIEKNQRALSQYSDIPFTSFPSFPEDFFDATQVLRFPRRAQMTMTMMTAAMRMSFGQIAWRIEFLTAPSSLF